MAAWARALVQGSHNAVNYQREFSFRCLYQVTILHTTNITLVKPFVEFILGRFCIPNVFQSNIQLY